MNRSISLAEFVEQIEKSKSYNVTELYLSSIPAELYKNNSMTVSSTAERDLHKSCIGKFATEKDENDYYRLIELIAHKKPLYPLQPVINPKDVVGLTLVSGEGQWTLNINELRELAASQIFGVIDTPIIKINSKASNCVKGEFTYCERGGKVIYIYQQTSGIQTIPVVSASYVNIVENGHLKKIRIKGMLTIPILRIPPKYRGFMQKDVVR